MNDESEGDAHLPRLQCSTHTLHAISTMNRTGLPCVLLGLLPNLPDLPNLTLPRSTGNVYLRSLGNKPKSRCKAAAGRSGQPVVVVLVLVVCSRPCARKRQVPLRPSGGRRCRGTAR